MNKNNGREKLNYLIYLLQVKGYKLDSKALASLFSKLKTSLGKNINDLEEEDVPSLEQIEELLKNTDQIGYKFNFYGKEYDLDSTIEVFDNLDNNKMSKNKLKEFIKLLRNNGYDVNLNNILDYVERYRIVKLFMNDAKLVEEGIEIEPDLREVLIDIKKRSNNSKGSR